MNETYKARRERRAFSAEVEARVLRGLAARMPAFVRPDHLTVLGVVGALGAAGAYALSTLHPGWLWLASAMLVLNWFGDSLDGSLARFRRAERPRYGYYLDHAVDALTTAMIGVGIGLSPFVHVDAALVLVVLYLVLSINVYLESSVFGVFRMDYGLVGPTEVRILLVAVNALLVWATTGLGISPAALTVYGTLVIAGLAAGMLALFLRRFVGNLRALARQEPARAGRAAHSAAPGATGTPAEARAGSGVEADVEVGVRPPEAAASVGWDGDGPPLR